MAKGNPAAQVRLTTEQRLRMMGGARRHGLSLSDVLRQGGEELLAKLDTEALPQLSEEERAQLAVGDAPPADDTPAPDEEGPGDDPGILDQLADVAAQIVHCPDYGDAFWNEETADVWWVACDGDPYPAEPGGGPDGEDVPAGTPFDQIEQMFLAVDGVETVTIEAENLPADDAGYVPVLEEGDGGDVNPPDQGEAGARVLQIAGLEGRSIEADDFRILGFTAIQGIVASGADTLATVDESTGEQGDSPEEAAPAEPPPATDGTPFRATLAIEGTPTDDGRLIEEGALEWRDPPLTLMAIIEDSHGGMPQTRTVVAGRIDTIERDGTTVRGTGVFDTGTHGAEIARLVKDKMLKGISIDLAVTESEEIFGDPDSEEMPEGAIQDPMMGGYLFIVKKGTIMGATVCPFPAFGEADIEAIAASGGVLPAYAMPRVSFTEGGNVDRMLLLGDFEIVEQPDVPAAPDGGTGGMIALYPTAEQAAAIADPDGNIAPEDLHLTLVYFPEMPDVDTLAQVVQDFADGYGSLTASVGGAGVLNPTEDETGTATAAQVVLVDALGLTDLRSALTVALQEAGITYAEDHDFIPHVTTDYDDPADLNYELGVVGQELSFGALSIVQADGTRVDVPLAGTLTASAAGLAPLHPPAAWFEYPTDLDEVDGQSLVPLTVTPEGRVYGHVAAFNECHIGSPGKCITAPHHYRVGERGCTVCGEPERTPNHSQAGYDFFHLGELETEEGDLVRVGQITLDTPHAEGAFSAKAAQRHYDDTGTAAADGVIYEDAVGPFFAGALRPDLPAERVRAFRAAKPSGDWRGIKGRREMIGVLMVNKPGYPIARRNVRVQDGEERELSLVAAGFPDPERYGTQPDCAEDRSDEIAALIASARGQSTLADLIAEARLPGLIASARAE